MPQRPRHTLAAALTVFAISTGVAGTAYSTPQPHHPDDSSADSHPRQSNVGCATARSSAAGGFERVATYPIFNNRPSTDNADAETSAEIAAITEDGTTVVYTDSPGSRIGFIDITTPDAPTGLGVIDLTGGTETTAEPTSVYVTDEYALVAITTSPSHTEPSGRLDAIRLADRSLVGSIDLGGQPDSIAVTPDGRHAVIAIENERDEGHTPPDGEEGDLPQLPAGFVQVVDLTGTPDQWSATPVPFTAEDGTALPALAIDGINTPEDPEPEYVTINSVGLAAVSLQENNGIVLIDPAAKKLTGAFTAGDATVTGVDATNDGLINPVETINGPREPDGIAWIDDTHLATANEGDYRGGTRNWTVFDTTTGEVAWDSGTELEDAAIRYGLHTEKRAAKKGVEPETVSVARFDGTPHAFVAAERSNFVAVYDATNPTAPELTQVLPTTVGPEGVLPVPNRDLLLVSSEVDSADDGIRSTLTIYQRGQRDADNWPSVVSVDSADGTPLGWGALSGLSTGSRWGHNLLAVSDNTYAHGYIYEMAESACGPVTITGRRTVTEDGEPVTDLDLEGISARRFGGYWVASEGKDPADNQLIRVNSIGEIQERVSFPTEITEQMGKWGVEGVAVSGSGRAETVYFVLQRPLWADPDEQSDPVDGANVARIGAYSTRSGEFTWFGYPLDESTGGWVGLSDVTLLGPGHLGVLERDKGAGSEAEVKRVYAVDVRSRGAATGEPVEVLEKREIADFLPAFEGHGGYIPEKVEGVARTRIGNLLVVTDNDGLDGASGETVLADLGWVPWR